MASGLPVVAARVGAMPEMIRDSTLSIDGYWTGYGDASGGRRWYTLWSEATATRAAPPGSTRGEPIRSDAASGHRAGGRSVRMPLASGHMRARGGFTGRATPHPPATHPSDPRARSRARKEGQGQPAYDLRPSYGIIAVGLTRCPWALEASSGFGARLTGAA